MTIDVLHGFLAALFVLAAVTAAYWIGYDDGERAERNRK